MQLEKCAKKYCNQGELICIRNFTKTVKNAKMGWLI